VILAHSCLSGASNPVSIESNEINILS
jgi:hypothetical protein